MTWVIVNIASSLIAAMIAAYLLGAHGHRFNLVERVGLGIMGGACILTIGPILTRTIVDTTSPYDDWSATLLRVGFACLLIGFLVRLECFSGRAKT